MIRPSRSTSILPALTLALLTSGAMGFQSIAAADDPPPPPANPGNGGPGHHHNPAFAACKKQADDQKLAPGDGRREFMKNCLKSAQAPAPAAT